MPAALVTGASGLLGRQVVRALDRAGWSVTGTAFSRANGSTLRKVDLASEGAVDALLADVQPQLVIHCAANRFPDKVDQDPAGTRRLNVAASRRLAQACVAHGVRLLVYISTDYVFAGRPGEAPYAADAEPAPPNLYGQTKLDGERAVLDVFANDANDATPGHRAVVLRVPVLYGHAETNAESAVNVLLDTVHKAQMPGATATMKMDDWSVRYPTNTEDVARVLVDIARKYTDDTPGTTPLPPVLQFSSEDRTTKYGICQRFAAILGVGLDGLAPDPTGGNAPGAVQRPFDCHLSTQALADLGIAVHTQDFVAWWRRELGAFRH